MEKLKRVLALLNECLTIDELDIVIDNNIREAMIIVEEVIENGKI